MHKFNYLPFYRQGWSCPRRGGGWWPCNSLDVNQFVIITTVMDIMEVMVEASPVVWEPWSSTAATTTTVPTRWWECAPVTASISTTSICKPVIQPPIIILHPPYYQGPWPTPPWSPAMATVQPPPVCNNKIIRHGRTRSQVFLASWDKLLIRVNQTVIQVILQPTIREQPQSLDQTMYRTRLMSTFTRCMLSPRLCSSMIHPWK